MQVNQIMQVPQIMQVTQIMQVNQNMQVNQKQKKIFKAFKEQQKMGSNYRIPVHYCIIEAASF